MRLSGKRIAFSLSAFGVLSCASASSSGLRGSLPAGCRDMNVEVRRGDLVSASAIMLAAQSEAGAKARHAMSKKRRWTSRWRRYDAFGGRSPLDHAAARMDGFDLCFSKGCDLLPKQAAALIFGCRLRACFAKGAMLIGPGGELLATATNDFEAQAGEELMVVIENRSYPRDALRRAMAAWHLLERDFRGDGRAKADVSQVHPDFTGHVAVRECRAG